MRRAELSFLGLIFLLASFVSTTIAETLKIGVTLPLTGAWADYGVAVRNGMELARNDHRELLKDITIIYEDDAYEPRRGIVAFEKLRTQDKVDLVVAWGTEPALAIAPVAENRGFPTIVGALDPRTYNGRKAVIGLYSPYREYACRIMRELERRNLRRILVISAEVSFFNGLFAELESCRSPGTRIERIGPMNPSEMDFRPFIEKMKSKSFDIAGVYLTATQHRLFFKQAAELRFKAKYFGASPFYDRILVTEAKEQLHGALLTHNRCTPEFHKHYFDTYGNDTHISYAANVYEFVRLAGELLAAKNIRGPANVLRALREDRGTHESVAGTYELKFLPDGSAYYAFPAAVYEITETGDFKLLPENN